jgi:hypothetical protein
MHSITSINNHVQNGKEEEEEEEEDDDDDAEKPEEADCASTVKWITLSLLS